MTEGLVLLGLLLLILIAFGYAIAALDGDEF
jgi:hypothetical protein